MRAVKVLLGLNGLVFLLRATLNMVQPASFYLEQDAPGYAVDAVRVLGITYGVLGLIQVSQWWSSDRTAVLVVAWGSLLFAAGVALVASMMDPSSQASFHVLHRASAFENLVVVALYGSLLLRERRGWARSRA